ncbi:hypothetical protein [Parachlamydia sp.]|uniref:hypothetical protein n=1 Tax=Parachlamydia sp. TaxID=2052048 RepID=UPI003D1401B6
MMEHKPSEEIVALKTFSSIYLDEFLEWATDAEVTKYLMWNIPTEEKRPPFVKCFYSKN